MATILVQIADRPWTLDAMHFAAAIATNEHLPIVLLRLIPVPHPILLGTEFMDDFSREEYQLIKECLSIAEVYHVDAYVQPMQYCSSLDALIQAAESLDSQIVFAHLRKSIFPFLQDFQVRSLRKALHPRRLYTLKETPNSREQIPALVS